jgi:hypothetical protein
MLCITSLATVERRFRRPVLRFFMATALFGMTLLVCECDSALFHLAAAQSTTDSSEAPPQVQFESRISAEGSISIVIFAVAAFFLVRWALREKPRPGKRYHRSFAPLCADDSDKRNRYRADAPDQTEDTPESGGDRHGGSD